MGTEAIRELTRADRYYLLVKVLKRRDALHPWIYERCREVEENPNGYIDIWSREHYKSTVITYAGIIQEVIRDPEISIGIFSHTAPIAKGFLAQIKREFESNQLLRELFPEIFWEDPQRQSPSWSLDNGIIVKRVGNPKECTVEANGLVDGQPTGKHYKLLVYDDVVTDKSVYTPDQIIKTNEAFSLSDNLGSIGGRKWICGTRYHHSDTYADIISRGAATPRIYPATDNGQPEGNPVLLPPAAWERKKKDQLESTISTQMLCNPLAGKQRIFNAQDLQVYEVRPYTLMAYLMVDPARSMKKDSANTAMVVLGIDSAGNKYFLDGVAHKMDLMDRWRWIRDLRERWSREPGIVSIQVGYERYGAIADLQYFEERQKIEKTAFEIVELEWPRDGEGSKRDRIQRLSPDFRGHRFYLPYPTDEDRLTSVQRRMVSSGQGYRISEPIKRMDENDNIYDVIERFKFEVSFFPYGGRCDTLDAASRIYDMEPTAPVQHDEDSLEPDYT